jgi:hypothetical protein
VNEYLKEHPENAFLLFTKVYIYYNNTSTPWNKLTQKQKDNKNFRWTCAKMYFLSHKPLTKKQIKHYIENDTTELNEPGKTTNKKTINKKMKSEDYVIYPYFPMRGGDVKVLCNALGLRMLHFVD